MLKASFNDEKSANMLSERATTNKMEQRHPSLTTFCAYYIYMSIFDTLLRLLLSTILTRDPFINEETPYNLTQHNAIYLKSSFIARESILISPSQRWKTE